MATKKLDTKQLQVEISNLISDFETKKKDCADSVTRLKVEELIFEVSYKFLVNKNFDIHSNEFELIRELMGDHSAYSQYVLLVKIYVSLCQVWSITQFYSVDFSQSRIGVNKSVFYKRTSVSCFGQCPGTPLTVSLYLCSSGSNARGESRALEGRRVSL